MPQQDQQPSSNNRPIRHCTHTGQIHRHGTRAAYVKDRCRCTPCTAANTAASRIRRHNAIFGHPMANPLIDATPARAHIGQLRAAGHGYQTLARLAGISTRHLRSIARTTPTPTGRPPIRHIHARLAHAILAISPNTPPALVEPTGTHRRLTALVALGWPIGDLAARLGRRPDSLTRTLTAQHVTLTTARQVATIYRDLACNPPPNTPAATAARRQAHVNGWVSPLAWDDIDTDPAPSAQPTPSGAADGVDEIAVERAVRGELTWRQLTTAETTEAIRYLDRRGCSTRNIAALLQASTRTIQRHAPTGVA